jgi:LmbE family N-acetylglucosaminyl deacetylase
MRLILPGDRRGPWQNALVSSGPPIMLPPFPRPGLLLVAVVLATVVVRGGDLVQDRGAAGAWQALLKLSTTASLLHTTAHPDDEHGGMLALMGRGRGVRTSLLTLNRGEAGDNALGAELFDALGLIRTEELRVAGRYYGLDRQYYSTVVDYGFSKRLDEAIEQWGRERVLRDMVRVIRIDRPLVIVSRFQGNDRDGHGQHQAAGLLTRDAFAAAADPARFPEQIAQGLRPWQALKLYMGGARENEAWHVRIDAGQYDPVLGDSYQNLARLGLSHQRSQTSGRFVESFGASPGYYVRLASRVPAPDKETWFFDGIDTSVGGLAAMLGVAVPASGTRALDVIEQETRTAQLAFTWVDPSSAAPPLARGLRAVRTAIAAMAGEPEIVHVLRRKEAQFEVALADALGVTLAAVAVPAGTPEPSGPFAQFAPAPTLGPVVPGQTIDVRVTLAVGAGRAVTVNRLGVRGQARESAPGGGGATIEAGRPLARTLTLGIPPDAAVTRPHLSRPSIAVNAYTAVPDAEPTDVAPEPPVQVAAELAFDGVPFHVTGAVQRREAQLPYGYAMRDLVLLPAVSVHLTPQQIMIPAGQASRTVPITVDVTGFGGGSTTGTVSLELPPGWRAEPAAAPFELAAGATRARVAIAVSVPALRAGAFPVRAVAMVNGRAYREGVDVIAHRDLDTRYRFRDATLNVAAVDVAITPGLTIGYVMGVGDEVPAAIEQLGAKVELLDGAALANGSLARFHAIVLGTRAYAVRADVRANNARLLEYARSGGHLIVLYNTPELDPATQAPFTGRLPNNAEEIAEQDAPVTILEPGHAIFTRPNRIGASDFAGWIEQRGSKFWSEWDPAYTPLLESHDRGQAPQRGGWLHARVGKGHYSYVAYAFHRQLPYGVPGAYRLFANLLSLR